MPFSLDALLQHLKSFVIYGEEICCQAIILSQSRHYDTHRNVRTLELEATVPLANSSPGRNSWRGEYTRTQKINSPYLQLLQALVTNFFINQFSYRMPKISLSQLGE